MARTGREIVPVAGRGLTGFFGVLGLAVAGSIASARFRLPLDREFDDLWRHNLQIEPRGGLALLFLLVGAGLFAFAVFAHLRPLVHVLVDHAAGTVSWVRLWKPLKTVKLAEVGLVKVSSETRKYDNGKTRGRYVLHRVRVPSLSEHEVSTCSSLDEAQLRARALAERLGTKVG